MSHRILKTNTPEPRGPLSDVSNIVESYWCWARNVLTESSSWIWQKKKDRRREWSISELRTDHNKEVVVYDAADDNDDDDDEEKGRSAKDTWQR